MNNTNTLTAAVQAYQAARAADSASRREARALNASRTFEEDKFHRMRVAAAKHALLSIARTIEL